MAAAEGITFADFQERFKTEEQCRDYTGTFYSAGSPLFFQKFAQKFVFIMQWFSNFCE